MVRTWIYSDPHFYHAGICRFTNYDGTPVRPWDDADVMSEEMIAWYNDVVRPEDRVYLLGDIAFTKGNIRKSLPRLMGRKVLVKGNHDQEKLSAYVDHVDDIRSYVVKKGFIMSHIPIHPDCMGRWEINIHGHLHGNHIRDTRNSFINDKRYVNVCVEQTNFRPKLLDEVLHEAGLK
jgi:calcineurin-like phosphoesterase family protein